MGLAVQKRFVDTVTSRMPWLPRRAVVPLSLALVLVPALTVLGFSYGPMLSVQPESATLSGGATVAADASASGGQSIKFASGSGSSCALPSYPDETCTGVPAGENLTIYDGDYTVSADDTVVTNMDIRGCLIIQAANVTVRNTKVTCTSFIAVASYSTDDGGLLLEDIEIDCQNNNTTGISYIGVTVRRAHIHNCENGMHIDRNVTLMDSYIHDIYEGATGHGDGIQAADGSDTIITHNRIYAESSTAAININNNAAGPTTTNLLVSENLLAGGGWTLYCPIPATVNARFIDNHFSNIFHPNIGTAGPSTDCPGEIQSGNVYHETGLPLTLQ